MNPALAGVALAVVLGAVVAGSARNARSAALGLIVAMVGGSFLADPLPGSLGLAAGRTLRSLFDFGDSWWHDITIEQTDGTPGPGRYPKVIEKHGASPPQYPDPEEDA